MPQIMDDVTVDGTVTADGFSGPLTGTASRATADASGNEITTTYATKTEVAAKQDALVSGTNIKTVNGTSLLGSGDIQIGTGQWTVRTANDDWSDLFSISGDNLTSLKNIYMYSDAVFEYYIPKGITRHIFRILCGANATVQDSTKVNINAYTAISAYTVPSSATNLTLYYKRLQHGTSGSVSLVNGSTMVAKSSITIFVSD